MHVSPDSRTEPIIPAAQVQAESDSRVVSDDGVVHFDREIKKTVRVISALPVSLTELRIKQCRVLRRINLDVRAAKTNQFLHFVAKDIDEISQIGINLGISAG